MKQVFLSLTLLFFVACSSSTKKERAGLRKNFLSGNYDAAIKLIDESDDYKDKENILLKSLEKGRLLQQKGDFAGSIAEFEKGKTILEALYTKKISKKIATVFTNENSDVYYGSNYEKSLLHFYQCLNFYTLFKKTGKRDYLFKARAEIVSWNLMLENLSFIFKGKKVFKDDLAAKVLGAKIHEEIGKSNELQISLSLYKEAYSLLSKQYGLYKYFNKKFKEFNKDYSSLKKLKPKKLEKEYFDSTDDRVTMRKFLSEKILRLTSRLRPRDLKKAKKRYPEGVKTYRKKKNENVTILLEENIIPNKEGKPQYFGLGYVLENPDSSGVAKVVAGVGAVAMSVFLASQLGISPAPMHYSPIGVHLGYEVSRNLVTGPAIEFELPVLTNPYRNLKIEVVAKNLNGVEVAKSLGVLLLPVGDIAENEVVNDSKDRYLKLGTRLAIKHITAAAASFATYSAMSSSDTSKYFAKGAAVVQYMGARKLIAASEKADVRYWATLPKNIHLAEMSLPEGTYQLYSRITFDQKVKETLLEKITISKDPVKKILHKFVTY